MNIIIGKRIENLNEKISMLRKKLEDKNMNYLFLLNDIFWIKEKAIDDMKLQNVMVRMKIGQVTEDVIRVCQGNGIVLSLIICDANDFPKMQQFKKRIFNDEFKYEFVINSDILLDDEICTTVAGIVNESKENIRIVCENKAFEEHIKLLEKLQNNLFMIGSDLVLNELSEKSLKSIDYVMLQPDKKLIEKFGLSKMDDEKYYTGVATNKNAFFYWFPETESFKVNDYLRVKNAAANRIKTMLGGTKPNNSKELEEQNYDMVFVYSSRSIDMTALPFVPTTPYYLASLVENAGFRAKVMQCNEKTFLNEYNKIKNKTQIFGFYCSCNNESLVANMIKYIKKDNENAITVVGGPQAIALDEAFFKATRNDIVTEGEGEGATIDLLEYYVHGKGCLDEIGNIKFIKNGLLIRNPQREVIMNLDEYPYAKVKRSEVGKYNDTSRVLVLTGRGCPNRCTFCYEGANARVVRFRSMDSVFEEINYWLAEFPLANTVQVLDDTFTCMPKRVEEFCERMTQLREKRNIMWICEVHINTIWDKPELLRKMLLSGCRSFQIGLESGSDRILMAYKKNTTNERIRKFIDMVVGVTKELSIDYLVVEGNIIIGGPFESKETIKESLDLCKYMVEKGRGIMTISSVCFSPLPNTDITNNPDKYGLTILWDDVDKSLYAMNDTVTCSEYLSKEEIENEKKLFDTELQKKVNYEVFRLTKSQLAANWLNNIGLYNDATIWGRTLNKYEHYINYAKFLNGGNKISIEPDVYPIRMMSDVKYLDKISEDADIDFSDMEKKIISYCTGKYSIAEIARKVDCTLEYALEKIKYFDSMCLVQVSIV